ncbi:MAG: M6 family metalloprotease domain-containing protein, partial [FCB group bacterium]|nr:M6 family metalloprotease domain-containing protein [FCB group bacterium]
MRHSSSSMILTALLCFCLATFVSAVPPTEEVIQKLKDEGRFDRYVESMIQARAKGVNNLPPTLDKDGRSLTQSPDQTFRVLIILIDFPDKSYTGGYASGTTADFDSLLFSYGINSTGSMTEYYLENSYGDFEVVGDVAGWYTAANNASYYTNYCDGSRGMGSYPNNSQKLIEEAVDAADASVDFSDYDNNNDGYVDGLFVVHAGTGYEDSGNDCEIHSHAWGINNRYRDGVWISGFSIEPEEEHMGGLIPIGVFCHEFGHMLGLPDLYDTDYSSSGIGRWGVMAGG